MNQISPSGAQVQAPVPIWRKVLRGIVVGLVWTAYVCLAVVSGVSGALAGFFGNNRLGNFFLDLGFSDGTMKLLLLVPLAVTFGPAVKRLLTRKFAPNYSKMLEQNPSAYGDGSVPLSLQGGFGTLQMGNKKQYYPLAQVARTVESRLPSTAAMQASAAVLSRQLTRYEQRKNAAAAALSQKFQQGELTFAKYADGISRADSQVYSNSAVLIRRIWEFDENDYREIHRELDKIRVRETKEAAKSRIFENDVIAPFVDIANDVGAALTGRDIFKSGNSAAYSGNPANQNDEIVRRKIAQNDFAIDEINRGIESNEKFIIQLDALTEEIHKLNGGTASEQSSALEELAKLTEQVKLYK